MSQSAQSSHMHTILQKQMSYEAKCNKNIKWTIDKPEKYRTWIMREQLWSQRKTHWPKLISQGGTLTVKCQPRESKRPKWGYMREDIESSRRGESSDIQEEGCSVVDQCSKDGVWPRLKRCNISSWKVCPENSTRKACMQLEDQVSPS